MCDVFPFSFREQEVTSSGQSIDAGSEVMDGSSNWEFKEGMVIKSRKSKCLEIK